MSYAHCVKTTESWKCLAPEIAMEINPHYDVTALQIGDIVITLDGEIKVEKINTKIIKDEKTFGYDLHFREGRNSYYANGLLVLLNYPEITSTRIRKNMENMSQKEKQLFKNLLEENIDLFFKVFGETSIKYFKEKNND